MIDADLIARARDADLLTTAEALGARLKRATATERVGPCLVCGGTDRFAINSKLKTWHCRRCAKGGNVIALVMHVRDCDFREAVAFLAGGAPSPFDKSSGRSGAAPQRPKASPEPKADPEHDAFVAGLVARIVGELVPLSGTPGERYLAEVRKIDRDAIADVLERTDAIGWHPSALFRETGHPLDGKRLGCVVAIMTDPVTAKRTGAIGRTYLTPELVKIGKAKTLGAPAGLIRLTPDEDVLLGLHLAEGLETALAAMSKGLRPMWATGSTALMAKFPVLGGIECLTLIVDHDRNRAGEEAAREAERRWRLAGREVRLLRSDDYGDFNDAVAREAK